MPVKIQLYVVQNQQHFLTVIRVLNGNFVSPSCLFKTTPRSWLTFPHGSQQFIMYTNISWVQGQNTNRTRSNALKCVEIRGQITFFSAITLPTIYNSNELFLTMVCNSLLQFTTICHSFSQFVTVCHIFSLSSCKRWHGLPQFVMVFHNL